MRYDCLDCGKGIHNYIGYMVLKALWDTYGVGRGCLCARCFSVRLGRPLCLADLKDVPLSVRFLKARGL
jgi:hypothetical protein